MATVLKPVRTRERCDTCKAVYITGGAALTRVISRNNELAAEVTMVSAHNTLLTAEVAERKTA